MANQLRFNLRAVNVPDNLPHRSRSREIEEIVRYLEVISVESEGLTLVHTGTAEPSISYGGLPWLKTNPDGSPAGLFTKYNGEWVTALPYLVKSEYSNLAIVAGSASFTLAGAADALMDTGDVTTFDPEFDTAPVVLITFTGGTFFDSSQIYQSLGYKVTPRKGSFSVGFKCAVDTSVVNRTVNFSWIAIGTRD